MSGVKKGNIGLNSSIFQVWGRPKLGADISSAASHTIWDNLTKSSRSRSTTTKEAFNSKTSSWKTSKIHFDQFFLLGDRSVCKWKQNRTLPPSLIWNTFSQFKMFPHHFTSAFCFQNVRKHESHWFGGSYTVDIWAFFLCCRKSSGGTFCLTAFTGRVQQNLVCEQTSDLDTPPSTALAIKSWLHHSFSSRIKAGKSAMLDHSRTQSWERK